MNSAYLRGGDDTSGEREDQPESNDVYDLQGDIRDHHPGGGRGGEQSNLADGVLRLMIVWDDGNCMATCNGCRECVRRKGGASNRKSTASTSIEGRLLEEVRSYIIETAMEICRVIGNTEHEHYTQHVPVGTSAITRRAILRCVASISWQVKWSVTASLRASLTASKQMQRMESSFRGLAQNRHNDR